jgi:hypothetical protein
MPTQLTPDWLPFAPGTRRPLSGLASDPSAERDLPPPQSLFRPQNFSCSVAAAGFTSDGRHLLVAVQPHAGGGLRLHVVCTTTGLPIVDQALPGGRRGGFEPPTHNTLPGVAPHGTEFAVPAAPEALWIEPRRFGPPGVRPIDTAGHEIATQLAVGDDRRIWATTYRALFVSEPVGREPASGPIATTPVFEGAAAFSGIVAVPAHLGGGIMLDLDYRFGNGDDAASYVQLDPDGRVLRRGEWPEQVEPGSSLALVGDQVLAIDGFCIAMRPVADPTAPARLIDVDASDPWVELDEIELLTAKVGGRRVVAGATHEDAGPMLAIVDLDRGTVRPRFLPIAPAGLVRDTPPRVAAVSPDGRLAAVLPKLWGARPLLVTLDP